jgi:RimJ/RimL family protein N-acetyltransferase
LLLRPIWPEDIGALFAAIADESVVRNLATAPWPYRESDAAAFAALPPDPLHPRFLITRAADGAVLGGVGIGPRAEPDCANDSGEGPIELGYWIARSHWGKGYATEAGAAVIAIAATLGHRELVAGHFIDNPASGRVLAKLGFEPTGQVISRFSCGRGDAAPAREYRLALSADGVSHQRAA